MSHRLSHAWCRDCDVAFLASIVCPRCKGSHVIAPPRGSTAPAQRQRPKERRWIEHDKFDENHQPQRASAP